MVVALRTPLGAATGGGTGVAHGGVATVVMTLELDQSGSGPGFGHPEGGPVSHQCHTGPVGTLGVVAQGLAHTTSGGHPRVPQGW